MASGSPSQSQLPLSFPPSAAETPPKSQAASTVTGTVDIEQEPVPALEKPTQKDPETRPVIKPAYPRTSRKAAKRDSSDAISTPMPAIRSKPPARRQKPDNSAQPLPVRPPIRSATEEFAVVQSLSLKDQALTRSMVLADGVEVRLKDTDADFEADFDLYVGKNRIKKIRDMKIGRSQIFAGASGGLYRLTLLGIHHPTHTVRVGIKPA